MQEQVHIEMPEAAVSMGVSVATIRRWIDTDGLPAVRVGRSIKIPVKEFEKWAKNHRKAQPVEPLR